MRSFTGERAALHLVGDPVRLQGVPLADAGDGFDWRVADPCYRLLLPDDLVFESRNGTGWHPVEPERVVHDVGFVSFPRCLRGSQVRLSGVFRPMTLAVTAEQWRLEVAETIRDHTETFGSETREVTPIQTGRSVTLNQWTRETYAAVTGELLALLHVGAGAFAGLGTLAPSSRRALDENATDTALTVEFDLKEVHHVPA